MAEPRVWCLARFSLLFKFITITLIGRPRREAQEDDAQDGQGDQGQTEARQGHCQVQGRGRQEEEVITVSLPHAGGPDERDGPGFASQALYSMHFLLILL